MLAATNLRGRKLINDLVRQFLQAALDKLRRYTPATDFSLDLFGLRPDTAKIWVSVSPLSNAMFEDWQTAAKYLINEDIQTDAVLRGHGFAASTQKLTDRGFLSAGMEQTLREVGVHGMAVWPVYARDDNANLTPALVLLSLTSDSTIFDDDSVTRLLRQTVSLLELGIIIGQREELPAECRETKRGAQKTD